MQNSHSVDNCRVYVAMNLITVCTHTGICSYMNLITVCIHTVIVKSILVCIVVLVHANDEDEYVCSLAIQNSHL